VQQIDHMNTMKSIGTPTWARNELPVFLTTNFATT
jgi:hypothetical protein